jgi:hypothetical protein
LEDQLIFPIRLDGGTAAKANFDKALRNSRIEDKGIPIPDSGHTFVLLAFAAGVIFLRLPGRL